MTTTYLRGLVEYVETINGGGSLSVDHAAGVTVLTVDSVEPFSATPTGSVQLNGTTYTYSNADPVAGTITISPALTAAAVINDPVLVSPLSPTKTAYVDFDDGIGDAMSVRVPHSLFSYAALADGSYTGTNRALVDVEEINGAFVIADIVAETPLLLGTYIDPTTVPTPVPTVPPASSPAAVVSPFAIRQLKVTWATITGAQFYDVYAKATTGVTTADELLGTTTGNLMLVSILGGLPLSTTADTYIAVVARNSVGSAAIGTEGHALPRTANVTDIAADYIYAGVVEAGNITSGTLDALTQITVGTNFTLSPPTVDAVTGKNVGGLIILDPADPSGAPLVQLHPSGCTFRGQITTDILTVMQNLTINGTGHLSSGAALILDNGIADPTVAPTLASGQTAVLTQTWPALPSGYTERGICWDSTNGQWYQLLWRSATNGIYYRTITTGGTASGLTLLITTNTTYFKSVTVINTIAIFGGYVYVCYRDNLYGNGNEWYMGKWTTAGTALANYQFGNYSAASDTSPTTVSPVVGNDLVNNCLVVAYVHASYLTTIRVEHFAGLPNSGLPTYLGFSYADTTGLTGWSKLRGVAVSNFDRGTPLLQIHSSNGTIKHWTQAVLNGTQPLDVAATTHDWLTDNVSSWTAWKVTTGGTTPQPLNTFYSSAGNSKLSRYSGYFPAASEQVYVKYFDKDATNKTTTFSPVANAMVQARRFVTATLRVAPVGVTGSDVFVAYATAAPANSAYYRRPEALAGRSLTALDTTTTGGNLSTATITNRVATTTDVTITTSAAHTYGVGELVKTAMTVADANIDGVYPISSMTATTYTYLRTGTAATTAALAGTATSIMVNTLGGTPAILNDGFGNSWTGAGVVTLPKLGPLPRYKSGKITGVTLTNAATSVTTASTAHGCTGTPVVIGTCGPDAFLSPNVTVRLASADATNFTLTIVSTSATAFTGQVRDISWIAVVPG